MVELHIMDESRSHEGGASVPPRQINKSIQSIARSKSPQVLQEEVDDVVSDVEPGMVGRNRHIVHAPERTVRGQLPNTIT